MLFIDKNQILIYLSCYNIYYKISSITSFYSFFFLYHRIYITEFKKCYKKKIQEFIASFNIHYLLSPSSIYVTMIIIFP